MMSKIVDRFDGLNRVVKRSKKQPDYYRYFIGKWEETQKLLAVEDGEEGEDYIAYLQLRNVEGLETKMIAEWVQSHPLPVGTEGVAFLRTSEINYHVGDSRRRARYLTRREFEEVFEHRVAYSLERFIENKRRELARQKGIEHDKKMKGRYEDWGDDESDRKVIDFFSSSRESNQHVYEQELENAYQQFYQNHKAYGLFGIKNESQRQNFEHLLKQTESGYFEAMYASCPTLGSFFFTDRKIRISEKERQRHTYVVGASGSGKSELLKCLIWSHLQKGFGVGVIDPNGDFAEQIVKFRENATPERREKVVYINPLLFPDKVPVINLFDVDTSKLPPHIVVQIVGTIFDVLTAIADEIGNKYTDNMQTVLKNAITVILETPGAGMRELIQIMEDERNAQLVELGRNSKSEETAHFMRHRFTEKTYDTARAGCANRLWMLMSLGLAPYLTGKTSVDIEEAMNNGKLIVFNLSKGTLTSEASRAYGKFIIAYIMTLVFRRSATPEEKRKPFHLYVDEFHNYATNKLQEAFEEGRKFKAYLTVATQVVGQRITTDMQSSIMGNTNVKIIGGAGRKSREAIAKEMDLLAKATGVDKKTLKELSQGEFIAQVGNNGLPFKIRGRKKLLGNRHSMTNQEWETIKQEQRERYYVTREPLSDFKAPEPAKPSEPLKSPQERREDAQNEGGLKSFSSDYDF
jgi:hypothetical protein